MGAPERLVATGGGFFIFSLLVSAVFVPAIRGLHIVQSLMYIAIIVLCLRRNYWGQFAGVAVAGLWNALAAFASPLFAEISEHPARPDLMLQGLGWLANLAVAVGGIWGYRRLAVKPAGAVPRMVLAFIISTGLLVGATAILAPDYLVAFTRARHPHWPWTRP